MPLPKQEMEKIEAALGLSLDPVRRQELHRDLLAPKAFATGPEPPTAEFCRAHAALKRQAEKVYGLAQDYDKTVYAEIIEMLDRVEPAEPFPGKRAKKEGPFIGDLRF